MTNQPEEKTKKSGSKFFLGAVLGTIVGTIAGFLLKWRGLIFAAGLSVIGELIQLITVKGLCEYDDVVHNMIDAAIGLGIVMMGKKA